MIKKSAIFIFLFFVVFINYSKPPINNLDVLTVKPLRFDTTEYMKGLDELISFYKFCETDTSNVYVRVVDDIEKGQNAARFPGGDSFLNSFLQKNIYYPRVSREYGIQGKVITKFIINENGKVCNLEILKIGGYGLPEEAIRILKMMPDWLPARVQGNPVKSYCILPVSFKIENTIIIKK